MITTIQFIMIVSIFNTGWALTWSRKDLANIAVKFLFAGLGIAGWYIVFKS
jgi:hypothetical protein